MTDSNSHLRPPTSFTGPAGTNKKRKHALALVQREAQRGNTTQKETHRDIASHAVTCREHIGTKPYFERSPPITYHAFSHAGAAIPGIL